LATEKPSQKPQDHLFEAVCQVTSIDWHQLTDTGRGPVNRAVSELRKLDATPEDVTHRAINYALRFETQPTPMALTKHWAQCATPPPNIDTKAAKRRLQKHSLGQWLTDWTHT